MAILKNIYFKDYVADWLKKNPQLNVSGLIDELLTEHIKKTQYEDMSREELEIEMKIAKLQKETKTQIEAIRNGRR